MKKIKSVMQLELEQTKLRLHEAQLEKAIRKDWKDVKGSLTPKNLGKQILTELISQKIQDKFRPKGILSESLAYGANMLAKKLGEKFKTFSGN